nr:hypothetical protein [uncultured Anaerostipes sp.]
MYNNCDLAEERMEKNMTSAIIGIVLLIFALLVYICYSYMQNQRSKYVSRMYKEFKEQYQDRAKIAMGFSQTNLFAKPVTVMLAVGEDHRVLDAWSVTDKEMELEGRTCEEYIGLDVTKYAREGQEKKEKELLLRQVSDPKNSKEQAFDMAVRQILDQLTRK